METDLTPWEEINPTALARQPAPPSPSLDPATPTQFRNELTACLALVVPVGMTEEARREWLAVAWETVKHLPADLLAYGAKKARETADHPSKIVPTILAEAAESLAIRREANRPTVPEARRLTAEPFTPCTPEEARAILAEYGLKSAFPSNREKGD